MYTFDNVRPTQVVMAFILNALNYSNPSFQPTTASAYGLVYPLAPSPSVPAVHLSLYYKDEEGNLDTTGLIDCPGYTLDVYQQTVARVDGDGTVHLVRMVPEMSEVAGQGMVEWMTKVVYPMIRHYIPDQRLAVWAPSVDTEGPRYPRIVFNASPEEYGYVEEADELVEMFEAAVDKQPIDLGLFPHKKYGDQEALLDFEKYLPVNSDDGESDESSGKNVFHIPNYVATADITFEAFKYAKCPYPMTLVTSDDSFHDLSGDEDSVNDAAGSNDVGKVASFSSPVYLLDETYSTQEEAGQAILDGALDQVFVSAQSLKFGTRRTTDDRFAVAWTYVHADDKVGNNVIPLGMTLGDDRLKYRVPSARAKLAARQSDKWLTNL